MMTDTHTTSGKTTIALDVLLTIARLTTTNVPGVSRLSPIPGSAVKNLLKRGQVGEGVVVQVQNNTVDVDIYVILNNNINIRDVGRLIQNDVSRAISEMVGMNVGRINVHVEDIDYPKGLEA